MSNGHKGIHLFLYFGCFTQHQNHLFLKSGKIVLVQTLTPVAFFRLLSEIFSIFFLVIILFRFILLELFLGNCIFLEITHFIEDFILLANKCVSHSLWI